MLRLLCREICIMSSSPKRVYKQLDCSCSDLIFLPSSLHINLYSKQKNLSETNLYNKIRSKLVEIEQWDAVSLTLSVPMGLSECLSSYGWKTVPYESWNGENGKYKEESVVSQNWWTEDRAVLNLDELRARRLGEWLLRNKWKTDNWNE